MKIIVKGRSMEPTMFEGETFIAVKLPTRKLDIGDIVIAKVGEKMIVKRIAHIVANNSFFDLLGDNKTISNDYYNVRGTSIKAKVICPTLWTLLLRRFNNAKKEK